MVSALFSSASFRPSSRVKHSLHFYVWQPARTAGRYVVTLGRGSAWRLFCFDA
jgi:hypothetical protein